MHDFVKFLKAYSSGCCLNCAYTHAQQAIDTPTRPDHIMWQHGLILFRQSILRSSCTAQHIFLSDVFNLRCAARCASVHTCPDQASLLQSHQQQQWLPAPTAQPCRAFLSDRDTQRFSEIQLGRFQQQHSCIPHPSGQLLQQQLQLQTQSRLCRRDFALMQGGSMGLLQAAAGFKGLAAFSTSASNNSSSSSASSSGSVSDPAQGFVRGGFTPERFPPERIR